MSHRGRYISGILNDVERSAWNREAGRCARLMRCFAGRMYESYEGSNNIWISHCQCSDFSQLGDGMDSGKGLESRVKAPAFIPSENPILRDRTRTSENGQVDVVRKVSL